MKFLQPTNYIYIYIYINYEQQHYISEFADIT